MGLAAHCECSPTQVEADPSSRNTVRAAAGPSFMQPDASILALNTLQGFVDCEGVSIGQVAEAAMPHVAAILGNGTGSVADTRTINRDVQLFVPAMTVWPSTTLLSDAYLQAQSEAFAADEERFLADIQAE